MDKKEKTFGKRELLLLLVLFAAAMIFYLVNQVLFSAPAAIVEVSIVDADSKKIVLDTFKLSDTVDYTIVTPPSVTDEPEGNNHLMIRNGTVWISEANCPNHDCVKKGKISQNGEMLVCIPHRLTVTILGK